MKSNKAFTVFMTRQERDAIKTIAKKEGISMAQLIRNILANYMPDTPREIVPLTFRITEAELRDAKSKAIQANTTLAFIIKHGIALLQK